MSIVHPVFINWKKKEELFLHDNAIIRNAYITEADVETIGHCGVGASLVLGYESEGSVCGYFWPTRNDVQWLGYIIKAVFETVLGEKKDDSVKFSSLVGHPIRVVTTGMSCDGIGNFIEDKWLFASDINEWIENEIDMNNRKNRTGDEEK